MNGSGSIPSGDEGPTRQADAAEAPAPDEEWDEVPGSQLVTATFAATGALVVAGAVGAIDPDGFGPLTAVVSGVLFAAGAVMMLWGYAVGVARSRDDAVTMGGLFFLTGSAPKQVRFRLRLATFVQVVVAVAVASARPYTAAAFAVLAPMQGMGAMALWGARHGRFPRREVQPRGGRRSRRPADPEAPSESEGDGPTP